MKFSSTDDASDMKETLKKQTFFFFLLSLRYVLFTQGLEASNAITNARIFVVPLVKPLPFLLRHSWKSILSTQMKLPEIVFFLLISDATIFLARIFRFSGTDQEEGETLFECCSYVTS